MAKNTSKKSDSFLCFWGNAIKNGWSESREKFGLVVDITLALSAFGLVGAAWYSKHHPTFDAEKEDAFVSYWFALIPVGLWLIWFIYHVLKAPHKVYLEIHEKLQIELERNRPKFKLSCNKDTEGSALKIPNMNGAFFRMRVETDCFGGIKNCVGNLLRIEKDGIVVFSHDTLKLPFAKAEDPKSLEKTVSQNTPEWLDVLVVYIYQPPTRSDLEVLVRAHNPHSFQKEDDRDRVLIATQRHLQALDINGNYIFQKAGEYILHVNVIGDGAPTEKAKLRFNWTGYAKGSTIEKIDELV